MVNLIVLFPKLDDAKNIRNLLVRYGFRVAAVCTTGASAINYADDLNEGIVVCGYRYPDMICSELKELIPKNFEMLLVASPKYWEDISDRSIVTVGMPIKVNDLVNTLQMIEGDFTRRKRKRKLEKPKGRSEEEKALIAKAKALLMERNNLSEEEAHRYIQKCSMDNGTGMVDTAQMVLALMSD